MPLHFAERPFRIQPWDTREGLAAFLSRCDGGSLFLDTGGPAATALFSVILYLQDVDTERFGIGVTGGSPAALPNLLIQPDQLRVLIGVGREVVGIDALGRKLAFRISCEGEFSQFVEVGDAGVILAFHAAGIVALSPAGSVLWRYACDPIADWACEQDLLLARIPGSPTVRLNVRTGTPVPRQG